MDTVVYIIIVLLGTTGNSVVIWVAGFRMKPNVTNVWLVNLAIADLIFCITQVTSLVKVLVEYWPFGDFLCKLTGLFKYTNMFCSVFLLAVISVDRVLCVWRPVFTRKRRTLCAARVISSGVWFVATIFSSPYFVYREVYTDQNNLSQCSFKKTEEADEGSSGKYVYFYIRFICGFLVPFLVIFTCYTLAAVGIRRTRLCGKSRPLRILALLVLAFFLCWAPYHILGLIKLKNESHPAVKLGWRMASNLAYFNSCVNPVLYFCMGLDLSQCCNQSLLAVFHRALTEEGRTLSQDSTLQDERLNCVLMAAGRVHHIPVSMTIL
ncbi:C3a anaphylatoxin chemotactic receptor-like [Triplophysa dalaica]|uniref:C3a anaphylatoxin chemotactic receptor-like n=1 Tax=Triplophysa dalaica TaxID=1582913 RepID=UPI0024DF5137|nr:C3a anaphylatoxin chemotactic receptor-like [Triplophysa dalaica]